MGSISTFVIIAIDGPAGSGKSTTARIVADRLNYLYIDTGAMYRAAALAFQRDDIPTTEAGAEEVLPSIRIRLEAADDRLHVLLNGDDVTGEIRQPAITELSSKIASLRLVREKLVEEQRRIASEHVRRGGGVVLDGRDIGTVVFPDADVKIFLTATQEIRARRRFHEMAGRSDKRPVSDATADPTYDMILKDIRSRDRRDEMRDLAPLRKAEDALEIDTSGMSVDDQVKRVLRAVMERDRNSAV